MMYLFGYLSLPSSPSNVFRRRACFALAQRAICAAPAAMNRKPATVFVASANPAVDLERVVGAGEAPDEGDVEGEPAGDGVPGRLPRGTQVGEDDVRARVA